MSLELLTPGINEDRLESMQSRLTTFGLDDSLSIACSNTSILEAKVCLLLLCTHALSVLILICIAQGMQMNPGVRTIEGVLEAAIHSAGGISKDNAGDPAKVNNLPMPDR